MKKILAGDPETMSHDVIAENIEQLRSMFPDAWTEGRLDFDILKQLLGSLIDDRDEKYGINWYGKRNARRLALTPSHATLRPCPEESMEWASTQNLFIEGDNLEVLKLLQKSYAGKIKLIYIDPPYNTGSDLIYPDNYKDNIANYLALTAQVDVNGQKLTSNSDTSGRFHTEWLNMLYPRLRLARTLLRDDGAIFISIDDREKANLKRICDEIFGEENYKGTIVRTTGQTTGQDSGGLGSSFDYVLVYFKSPDEELSGLPLDDDDLERYEEEDERGKYAIWQLRKTGSGDRRADRPTMFYPVKDPDGNDVLPIGPGGYESRWRFDRKGYARLVEENFILWKKRRRAENEEWWPYVKTYLEGRTKRPSPLWDDLEGSKKASIDLRALLGDSVFSNPKPVGLIRRIIQILPKPNDSSIVMDFFAGSGTTAQAVLECNLHDSGNRRYILVQLPEPLDPSDKAQKPAADYCKQHGKPMNIAEITKERIRRCASKVKSETPMFSGDIGFRVFKLDSSNINAWDPDSTGLDQTLLNSIEHIKPNRAEADVLYELLLKLGLDLCVPIEQQTFVKKVVYSVGAGVLFVCLDPKILRDEAELLALGIIQWHKQLNPAAESSIVFRDSSFEDDVTKTNITVILQQHGLGNVRSL